MGNFWPEGLELNDLQSPMEILQDAQHDWESHGGGLLTLVLQPAKSQSDNDMIIVHAQHVPSNRTTTLFTVVYRPANPYPVTIQPKNDELPKFLKKSYYESNPFRPFSTTVISNALNTEGRTVKNRWVSDTPSEFREKLEEVFNLGIVKSEILNLMCDTSTVIANDDTDPDDSPNEED